MSEQTDLNRRVADLLGWKWSKLVFRLNEQIVYIDGKGNHVRANFTTDANQADAAVMEWCGDDLRRQMAWSDALIVAVGPPVGSVFSYTPFFSLVIAKPEQKIRALLAAADALKGEGGAS